MSTQASNEKRIASCGIAADAGLVQLGGITLGQLADGLNWHASTDAEVLKTTPWAFQDPTPSQAARREAMPTSDAFGGGVDSEANRPVAPEPDVVRLKTDQTEAAKGSAANQTESGNDEPQNPVESAALEPIEATDSGADLVEQSHEVTQGQPVHLDEQEVIEEAISEPASSTAMPESLPNPPAAAATAQPASCQTQRSTNPVSAKMTPLPRLTTAQRPSASSDDYLGQLEQLVVELNVELCLPQTSEQAGSTEAQIQALTQRLISLSLENLQLRRKLAGGTEVVAN